MIMIDYFKQNHLSLFIIVYLAVASMLGGEPVQPAPTGGSYDRTTFENPITFTDAVTFSSTVTPNWSTTTAERFVQGGSAVASSTTGTTDQLKASDIRANSVFVYTPANTDVAMTLQASTTAAWASLIPNAGDMVSFTFYNATTSAGTAIGEVTFSSATGVLLSTSSTTASCHPLIPCEFTFIRLPSTDITALMTIGTRR